jgi:predicted nucleic acid-binding protein
MVQKYFLDTCIWRDFYELRKSKSGRELGLEAELLILKIIKRKDLILFSESLYKELKNDYTLEEINYMFQILFLAKVLVKIDISKDEFYEAKKLAIERNLPFIDCLNAVQARNNQAIMVTQDKHFFESLKDITLAKKPSEIN